MLSADTHDDRSRRRDRSPRIRSIAILNPLGDYGIAQYCHELGEALVQHGVRVEIYASGHSIIQNFGLHQHYRFLPVLGTFIFKQYRQVRTLNTASTPPPASQPATSQIPTSARHNRRRRSFAGWFGILNLLRTYLLPLELACVLKIKGHDLVWTQWPHMPGYGILFRRICRWLGMPVVHTVHNVLPHDEKPGDRQACGDTYRWSDLLFVHSHFARAELQRAFPEVSDKVIVSRHGMYTLYPRIPDTRSSTRRRLFIDENDRVILFCGGIRPYKNIDAVLAAIAERRWPRTVLIVSGEECEYPDHDPLDRLLHTRSTAEKLGIADKVRLIPSNLFPSEQAALLEASDILVLPYLKSYGSGLLLLGMTFGLHMVASRTGGMEEYLQLYKRHTLLRGTTPTLVADGIDEALTKPSLHGDRSLVSIQELSWAHICDKVLSDLASRLFNRSGIRTLRLFTM